MRVLAFNTGSMPSLIDRIPEHTRIESSLQYGSMYSAYPGLDDRFKNNWGARFSGLIDIPDSGNWTFYLTSDDGSELWIDGTSLVTNYGSHGMREKSGVRNLSSGLHDFKIEFFQGGGPHGLNLWEGPNQSKAMVACLCFCRFRWNASITFDTIHAWNFDEGFGTESNDSAPNGSSMTLYNMDASNWRSCADGGCLWYDGVDDYVEVDVDDWVGNFTVVNGFGPMLQHFQIMLQSCRFRQCWFEYILPTRYFQRRMAIAQQPNTHLWGC